MKKIFTAILFFLLSILFFSCSDVDDDAGIISADVKDKTIILAVPYKENADYINIFRKEADDTENSTVKNIGQIIPASETSKTYIFTDSFAVSDTEYQYCARYKILNEYESTDWSDAVSVTTDYSDSNSVPKPTIRATNDTTTVSFEYSKDSATLKLVNSTKDDTASIELPTTLSDYNLCLVVSNGSTTTTFDLDSTAGESYSNSSTALNLTSTLTTGYFNKSITIDGIVGQYVYEQRQKQSEDDSELRYTIVYWTDITEIKVTGDVDDEADDNGNYPFVVKYASSDNGNYDFSSGNVAKSAISAKNLIKNVKSAETLDLSH